MNKRIGISSLKIEDICTHQQNITGIISRVCPRLDLNNVLNIQSMKCRDYLKIKFDYFDNVLFEYTIRVYSTGDVYLQKTTYDYLDNIELDKYKFDL